MPNLTYISHDDILDAWGPDLTIGLLQGQPNPDGTGVVEQNSANGYARQDITLLKTQEDGITSLANEDALVWGPAVGEDWQPVDHFGIFDANDVLRCYGRLRTTRTVTMGEGTAFPAGSVAIRFR